MWASAMVLIYDSSTLLGHNFNGLLTFCIHCSHTLRTGCERQFKTIKRGNIMLCRKIGVSALCAVLSISAVFAQVGTSSITGRTTDTSGAVIARVAVTIVQPATNFQFAGVTNEDGIYRVPSLSPGLYRITFEAPGFKRTVRDNVDLRTGDTLAVDAVLQIGNVTESVEVTATTPLLETETSATGTVVEGDVLHKLPMYQRYVVLTLTLTPGMTMGGYAGGGDLGAYHVAGQRAGAIGIFEDG